MPTWAGLENADSSKSVDSLLAGDFVKSDQLFKTQGRDTYWYGKGLGAVAQLLSVAEAEGETGTRDKLLGQLKDRLRVLVRWETLQLLRAGRRDRDLCRACRRATAASPHMNDHHFHYGYWSWPQRMWRFATRPGRRTTSGVAWSARSSPTSPPASGAGPTSRFSGISTAYEGHSWASGDANFDAGNNQESSSEAVNAWAGLILWGEATGDEKLRDLGIYLLTSEIASVQHYWFDLNRQVLAPEFDRPFASMVFGGKYAYNTWWTVEPRQITGINLLPITTASTYLGQDPAYVRKVMDALPGAVAAYQKQAPERQHAG